MEESWAQSRTYPSVLDVIEENRKIVECQLHEVLQRWLKRIDNIYENVCLMWSQHVEAVKPINRALFDEIK